MSECGANCSCGGLHRTARAGFGSVRFMPSLQVELGCARSAPDDCRHHRELVVLVLRPRACCRRAMHPGGGHAPGRSPAGRSPPPAHAPGVCLAALYSASTGITDQMLRGQPRPEEVMPALHKFVRGLPIVAHNASFDRAFLQAELARAGLRAESEFLCTMRLARPPAFRAGSWAAQAPVDAPVAWYTEIRSRREGLPALAPLAERRGRRKRCAPRWAGRARICAAPA